MTPYRLFVIMILMNAGLFLITGYCWIAIRRAYRLRDQMTDKLVTATQRFADTKIRLTKEVDDMRLQLEKAEQAAGDAAAGLQFKDQQIISVCELYKKLKTRYQDLKVSNDHLVGQYNSLVDKMQPDGDMPT